MKKKIKEGDIIYHKSNPKILFMVSSVEKYSLGILYKCRRVNDDGSLLEQAFTDYEVVKIES